MCQVDPSNEPNRPHISSRYQIFKQHRQKTARRTPTHIAAQHHATFHPNLPATPAEPSDPAPVTPNRVPAAGEALSRQCKEKAQEENEEEDAISDWSLKKFAQTLGDIALFFAPRADRSPARASALPFDHRINKAALTRFPGPDGKKPQAAAARMIDSINARVTRPS